MAASRRLPLDGDDVLSELGLADGLELAVVGGKDVEGSLEELVSLDLLHARGRGALPLDEDVAGLVGDLAEGEAEGEEAVAAGVVGESVTEGVDTNTSLAEEELVVLDVEDDPGAVDCLFDLIVDCVGDAHFFGLDVKTMYN